MRFFDNCPEGVEEAVVEIVRLHPDFIGLSLLQNNFLSSLIFSEKYRGAGGAAVIMVGNLMANLYPVFILENYPSVDYVVLSEGEETTKELSEAIISHKDISAVAGIAYRDDQGKVQRTPHRDPPAIENLPYPDRHFYEKKQTIYSMIGSRSCYGKCSFCESRVVSKKLRRRTIPDIVREMKYLAETYDCKYICFHDSTFCDTHDNRLHDLGVEMDRNDLWIQFFINLRPDSIHEESIGDIAYLNQKGLEKLFVGFEAGNNEDLRLYNKHCTVDDHYRVLRLLKNSGMIDLKTGINVDYGFITFNPYTTRERLRENIEFLAKSELYVTPQILSRRLIISAGSTITKRIKEDGLLLSDPKIPLLDFYAYRFLDETILSLWEAICYVDDQAKIPNFINIVCMQERLKHLGMSFHEDAYELLRSYQKQCSYFSLDIFASIIDRTDYNTMDEHIREFRKEIIPITTCLGRYVSEYSKALVKAHEAVY